MTPYIIGGCVIVAVLIYLFIDGAKTVSAMEYDLMLQEDYDPCGYEAAGMVYCEKCKAWESPDWHKFDPVEIEQ